MITRLEVDGFKSFAEFSIEFSPLVAIVGPNASGKSNIFDAITLLSRVVSMPLAEALTQGRGEPDEQFRRLGDGTSVPDMRFAVELLLEPNVTDDFDQREQIEHTRLRYELWVTEREDGRGIRRPYVTRETIRPLQKGQDTAFEQAAPEFRRERLKYGASQWKILETEERDGRRLFLLRGKRARGAPQGRLQELPAARASSSVLSSITTAGDYPFLYAVRREIESWRFLQLDPAALRLPTVSGSVEDHLRPNGANLAWILHLIDMASTDSQALGLLDMAADLARVIKGFAGLDVTANEARGQWEVYLRTRDEGRVSARVASDGTLRLLALLAALYEPDSPGVLAFEEPENGINPQRLGAMLQVLTELVTDASQEAARRPLVQLLMTSHSPLLLLKLEPADIVVVDSVSRMDVGSTPAASRVTRARRVLAPGETLPLPVQWPSMEMGEFRSLPGILPDEAAKLLEV